MAADWEVRDYEGAVVAVGARVLFGADDTPGVVTEISEPDADYDDELQRGVEYTPKVTVRFEDGDTDTVESFNDTPMTWADYPDGPRLSTYRVDDLKVDPAHPVLKATIVKQGRCAEDHYSEPYAELEDGRTEPMGWNIIGAIFPVGTTGTAQYVVGQSSGLWLFKPDEVRA